MRKGADEVCHAQYMTIVIKYEQIQLRFCFGKCLDYLDDIYFKVFAETFSHKK